MRETNATVRIKRAPWERRNFLGQLEDSADGLPARVWRVGERSVGVRYLAGKLVGVEWLDSDDEEG